LTISVAKRGIDLFRKNQYFYKKNFRNSQIFAIFCYAAKDRKQGETCCAKKVGRWSVLEKIHLKRWKQEVTSPKGVETRNNFTKRNGNKK